MNTKDFFYELPEALIAQTPVTPRSDARLLVLDRTGDALSHEHFYDIIDHLKPGDCLVLNDTRVIPARLFGTRETGASVEFLLLRRLDIHRWECLVKPGKKARPGDRFVFGDGRLKATIESVSEGGARVISFEYQGVFEAILDALGTMPLPPYITERLEDPTRYNTVYAKYDGSAAAPTAGLHFTEDLLERIEAKGVHLAYVTLHVGLGTFRPVKEADILDHEMHSEYYEVTEAAAARINAAKASGGRIISVGTTATRTLESVSDEEGCIHSGSGWTDIFIYPGYRFKIVDALITNFHLPESTLIMLVSAFCGQEHTLNAYKTAVDCGYRFFSFGDAMFIR